MVHCRYTIGALVLRFHCEVHGVEGKIICGILKESAPKKVLTLIIQNSTNIDIIRLKIPARK